MSTTRARGFIEYNPRSPTVIQLIADVKIVLEENKEYLPLTIRQIFYRLVVKNQINKTEKAYKNKLLETMVRARRGRLIPMDSIRDDGFSCCLWQGYSDEVDYIDSLLYAAETLKLDLQNWQDVRLVVWCEAMGMKPQLEAIADKYSIPVLSSGGFDSVTSKHDVGEKLAQDGYKILHIGDFDPSGEHIASSLDEDINAFAKYYGGCLGFERIAVTESQGIEFDLPTAPPKEADNRSFSGEATIQAEALPPETLANILEGAILRSVNVDKWKQAVAKQDEVRLNVSSRLAGLIPSEGCAR